MSNRILYVFTALILVFGCKSKKEITKAAVPSEKTFSKMEVLNAARDKQLYFNTLSMKAKAGLSIDNRRHDVSMSVRMKKDEAIWVSVTVIAGIEVARALITPDSIKILNRIESTYTKKPFSFIHQYTNEQLNFKTLQTLLIGSTDPAFISGDTNVSLESGKPVLSGLLNGLTYSFILNENNKIVQTSLKDEGAGQQLTAKYSDFYALGDQIMPYTVNISSAAGSDKAAVNLNYSQVTIDETLDFPFSVPKRFTIKD